MTRRRDGRRQGQGWWLEETVANWLEFEYNLTTELNQHIYSFEVDVIAYSPPPNCRRVLVQCKDWQSSTITPPPLWRLSALAQKTDATPLLAQSAETNLSQRARAVLVELGIGQLSVHSEHTVRMVDSIDLGQRPYELTDDHAWNPFDF